MNDISIKEIENDPTNFIRRVEAGETFVVSKSGKPVAEVKPIAPTAEGKLRPYGLCAGEFTVPDDFDGPLPEDVLKDFEN